MSDTRNTSDAGSVVAGGILFFLAIWLIGAITSGSSSSEPATIEPKPEPKPLPPPPPPVRPAPSVAVVETDDEDDDTCGYCGGDHYTSSCPYDDDADGSGDGSG